MKKILVILLAGILAYSLTACSSGSINEITPESLSFSQDGGEQSTSQSSTTETTTQQVTEYVPKCASLMAIGDNLLHPPIYYAADETDGSRDQKYDFSKFFESIRPEIDASDLKFINQETISAGDHRGLSGYPSFNSPEAVIHDIARMGFNLVAIANNHAIDKGGIGVDFARNLWDSYPDIAVDGAFISQEDFDRIRYIEVGELKFAFLAFTTHTNGIIPDHSFRVAMASSEMMIPKLEEARANADFVIVSMHWGADDSFYTGEEMRNLAGILAEKGADLVIGTGPHVIHPVEWIASPLAVGGRTLVAFSLGNYLSAMHGNFNELELMLTLDFVEGVGIENAKIVPLVMHLESDLSAINVYKLSDYTEELASRHFIRRSLGKDISIEYFNSLLEKYISEEFR